MNIYVINMIYKRDMQRSGRNADRTRGRRRVNYTALLISTLANLVGRLRPRPKPWISFSVPWLSLPFSQFLSVYLDFRALKSAPTLPFSGGTPITRGWRVVLLIGAMLERARRREGDTSWVNCWLWMLDVYLEENRRTGLVIEENDF